MVKWECKKYTKIGFPIGFFLICERLNNKVFPNDFGVANVVCKTFIPRFDSGWRLGKQKTVSEMRLFFVVSGQPKA